MAVFYLVVIGVAFVVMMTAALAVCAFQRYTKRSKQSETKRAGYDVINRTSANEVNFYSSPVAAIDPEIPETDMKSSGYNYVPSTDRTGDYYDLPLFIKGDHPRIDKSQTLRHQCDKQTVIVRRFGSETYISIEDRRPDKDLISKTGVTTTNTKPTQDKSRSVTIPQRNSDKESVYVDTTGSESRIHLSGRIDVNHDSKTSKAGNEFAFLGTKRLLEDASTNRVADNKVLSQHNQNDFLKNGTSANIDDSIADISSPSSDLSLSSDTIEDQGFDYLKLSECISGQRSADTKAIYTNVSVQDKASSHSGVEASYINASVPDKASTHSGVEASYINASVPDNASTHSGVEASYVNASVPDNASTHSGVEASYINASVPDNASTHSGVEASYINASVPDKTSTRSGVEASYINASVPDKASTHSGAKTKNSLIHCDVNFMDSVQQNSAHYIEDDHVSNEMNQPHTNLPIKNAALAPLGAAGISIDNPDSENMTKDAVSGDEERYVFV
ncbi:hypothetical protein Btru_005491 [Bulinus truncatus]|nr:hypothetical protein Btru_005491 [Bulinus truncatus]